MTKLKTNEDFINFIEANTLRVDASYRGGGIEIDCSELLPNLDEPKMASYQNYLGGGMLGAICNNCNFDTESLSQAKQAIIFKLADALNRYFHNLTNHEGDEWEEASFEQNQLRPTSGY